MQPEAKPETAAETKPESAPAIAETPDVFLRVAERLLGVPGASSPAAKPEELVAALAKIEHAGVQALAAHLASAPDPDAALKALLDGAKTAVKPAVKPAPARRQAPAPRTLAALLPKSVTTYAQRKQVLWDTLETDFVKRVLQQHGSLAAADRAGMVPHNAQALSHLNAVAQRTNGPQVDTRRVFQMLGLSPNLFSQPWSTFKQTVLNAVESRLVGDALTKHKGDAFAARTELQLGRAEMAQLVQTHNLQGSVKSW